MGNLILPVLSLHATTSDVTYIPASNSSLAMSVLFLKAATVHPGVSGVTKVEGLT